MLTACSHSRLNPLPNTNERTVSPQGAEICGVYIPAGTDVSVARACTARDETVFGPRPHRFGPEKWLDADEDQQRIMDSAGMGFSWGRRACIGQHLARIEMKKVLASIVKEFEVSTQAPVLSGL